MPKVHGKLPCVCDHGKAIHHARRIKVKNEVTFRSPCNFPGCKCHDYKLAK